MIRICRVTNLPYLLAGCLAALVSLSGWSQDTRPAGDDDYDFFEKRIRPVIHGHCLECHGEKKQKGGLRLDFADGWKIGGDSGPAIIPHKPAGSLLIEAVSYHNRELEMPPDGKLPGQVIEDFKIWISTGAPDPRMAPPAAIRPPRETSLEKGREFWSFQPVQPAAIPETGRPMGAIDAYISQGLMEAGIRQQPEADRQSLIRRLYFDLTGLPPSPDEVEAFVLDKSPDAWPNLVDRLLGSRHFGEKWGRHWLDVVRFAESSGGGRTLLFPEAWRYRDYVIQAFNNDLPYDEFLKEQLAGDLMESDGYQVVSRRLTATGFLLLGPTNYELQDKDILEMDIVDEQLDTMSKAVMGLTMGCARCHDHKFDPIPTADYYAMAGIFKNTHAVIHDNVSRWNLRDLPVDPATSEAIKSGKKQVNNRKKQLETLRKQLEALAPDSNSARIMNDLTELVRERRGMIIDNDSASLEGDWIQSTSQPGYAGADYLHDGRKSSPVRRATYSATIPSDGEYEVLISYSPGSNRSSSVPVEVFTGLENTRHRHRVNQKIPGTAIGGLHSLGLYTFTEGSRDIVQISNEGVTDGHVIADAVVILPTTPTQKTDDDANQLRIAELQNQIASLEKEIEHITSQAPVQPVAMAVDEKEKFEEMHIAIRGVVSNKGPRVGRGALQVINSVPMPRMPEGGSGRLQLAEWLTHPEHPLTSRVMANRVWAWLFGRGIVRSVDNFGKMGSEPTHPELLDYLSRQLVDQGWSIKKLVREIVLSETYRMGATHNVESYALDPSNDHFWRMPRKRLDAEAIRDSILRFSDQLDLAYLGNNIREGTGIEYGYVFDSPRRSVYLPVFRNTLPEIFETFDFADPNMMNGKRNTSAVATQALLMMNSPFIIEHSRAAAGLALKNKSISADQKIHLAFLTILGRAPNGTEMEIARGFLESGPENRPDLDSWAMFYQTLLQSIDFRYLN